MQYDFTLQPGGGQVIESVGRFIKYVSGTGKIRVRLDKGGYLDLMPGQGASGLDFSKLIIEDRTGSGNVGTLLAGAFLFQDDRISGTVDVVDGGKSRTLANQAFISGAYFAPDPSFSPYSILFNPAGTGKNVWLEKMTIASSTAGAVGFGFHNAALGALTTAGTPKRLGAAVGVATPRAYIGPGFGSNFGGSIYLQAGATFQYEFTEPVLILPGFGFHAFMTASNIEMRTQFEYFEEGQ